MEPQVDLTPLFDGSGAAAVAETHISVLFFVGDKAYKLKKPVVFPFADFRERRAREVVCHREVELNRRLAPDVYLGVADIGGPDGAPCDHLVVMRRMPDDRRLAHLVTAGDPAAADALDALAEQLAAFHAAADRSPAIDRSATPAALAGLWSENFDELAAFADTVVPSATLDRATHLARSFLSGRRALFLDRIAQQQVCDGHGDLQADDVFCLEDGPRALDCIEFSDELRHGDVAGDIAFLAMDLERLGAPTLAERFVSRYEAASGRAIPPALLHLSIAYRAQVRAKVTCLRAHQQEPGSEAHETSAEAARHLLDLCVRHLEAAQVHLVVVGGLPGTGKSTVAAALGRALGATVVRSDVVRKERAGLDPGDRAGSAYGAGLYRPEQTEQVYAAMLDAASPLLEQGTSVVLDASFADARHREAARQLAERRVAALTELRCVVDADEARARILRRLAETHDASDATPEVAGAMAASFAPWPEARPLDTSLAEDEVARAAEQVVRG